MEAQQHTQQATDGSNAPTYSPGDRFSRYEIVEYIGFGAMSEVYEATHLDLQKPVALKLLRLERVGSQTARARFLREGRAAARLRHPGVVEIYDVGEEEGRPFLVMELLEGESLEGYLVNRAELTPEQAVQLVLPIAAAVQCAHDAGVLHRDLKPENVFLTKDGPRRIRPKIVDFGISSFLDADASKLTMDSDILGTPQYMAPEQARGEGLDGRADQYALAVMVYEMITGRLPHEKDSLVDLLHAVAYEPSTPLAQTDPSVPASLADAVDRALAYNREDRFPTVRDFAMSLLDQTAPDAREFWREELTGSETSPTPSRVARSPFVITMTSLRPPEERVSSKNSSSRSGWLVMLLGIIGLLAVLLAGAVYFGMANSNARPGAGEGGEAPATAASAVPSNVDVNLRTVPDTAEIFLDGELVGTGSFTGQVPVRDQGHEILIRADGFKERAIRFSDQAPSVVYLSSARSPVGRAPEAAQDSPPVGEAGESRSNSESQAAPRRRPFRPRRGGPAPSAVEPTAPPPVATMEDAPMVEVSVMREPTMTTMTQAQPRTPPPTGMGNRNTDNLNPWSR